MSVQEHLEEVARVDTLNAYVAWEEQCNARLEMLREECQRKRPRIATGAMNSYVAQIVRLERLRVVTTRTFYLCRCGQREYTALMDGSGNSV